MKRILSLLVLCFIVSRSFAQLSASADTSICRGQSVQLTATGGTTYSWSPATGLNAPNTASPVATPTVTTTYVVTSPVNSANIAINGDFSQGNTGFTSSYLFESTYNILGSAAYFVGENPNNWNNGMSFLCSPRTNTDTNMLVANGATTAGIPVWCQTLSVLPNINYNLEVYLAEMNNQNYPSIQWTVNGVNVGNPTQAIIFPPCIFTPARATWNSGVNTTATFCLVDPVTAGNGNDFALDDISIKPSGNLTDTVVVTIATAPAVNLGSDTAVCPGQPVLFDAGNAGATYLWSDNSTQQTLNVNSPGTYRVTVTNSNNCTATDAADVTAYTLQITLNSVNTTCGLSNGKANVAVLNGNAPFTYIWNNAGTTDTITNLSGGTYSVTVNDAKGCTASDSTQVNTSGAGSVSVTVDNPQICAGDTAHVCAPAGYASYLWNTGSVLSCINVVAAGNYRVTVTDNANCTSSSNAASVGVFSVPPVSVSVKGDTLSAFNAVAYQWFLNGNEINGANNSVYIAPVSGNYTVQVTDTNGCKSTSNVLSVTTGVEDVEAGLTIDVYPNPNTTGNWIVAVGNGFIGSELQITDVAGKLIYKNQVVKNKTHLALDLASGVYLLKIAAGQKQYVKKLVRQ